MVTDTFACVFSHIIRLHINKGSVIIRQFIAHTAIRSIHVIIENKKTTSIYQAIG